jgi:hypothetical protein
MPVYNPPLRDMQFVLHELLHVSDEFKALPKHAETDIDTVNAILASGTYLLGSSIENLTLLGAAAVNGTGNASNQIMWEVAANSTVNHFGVSTTSKLAVNDTLTLKVTQGNVTFDVNDNWSVAFIG